MHSRLKEAAIVMFAMVGAAATVPASGFDRAAAIARASEYDGVIGRDQWGVPRVHGSRDADAAFALGYAFAEDDFALVQEAMMAGNMHRLVTRDAAEAQTAYLLQLLRVPEEAEGAWPQLAPATRAYLDAYADGVNLYAARHPEEVARPDLFPLTGMDILRNAIFQSPLFYGMSRTLSQLVAPGGERSLEAGQSLQVKAGLCAMPLLCAHRAELGSNAFAVAPAASSDGATRLIANSHQPLSGILAWLEATVSSDEGLNFTGGAFPGSPMLLLGANADFGWAATVNRPDLIDTYKLTINPDNPAQYRLDGEWRDFDQSEALIRVREGPGVTELKRPLRWSVHGPVFDTDEGAVALRWASMDEALGIEDTYRLMKARSVAEGRAIVAQGRIPSTYRVMADREGNIARYYLARMPERVEGPDWKGMLPGDDSSLVWTGFEPFETLPHVENPPEGWVTEANSSPFQQMGSASDPKASGVPGRFGIETDLTNRARRATALMKAAGKTDRDALWAIKMDTAYDPASLAGLLKASVLASPWASEPDLAEAVALLKAWDLYMTADNRSAGIALLTFQPIGAAIFQGQTPPTLRASLEAARDFLMRHHGRLDVEWSKLNQLHRGEKRVPLAGGPDVLRAVSSVIDEPTGTLRAIVGDGLVILVEWDEDGRQRVETVSPYGAATGRPGSPHHDDQMEMFAAGLTKRVPMDLAERNAMLVRQYRPGEE
ncbi:MAG: penicillin acylase family protein [Erythrobacter sp.]|jgi:penicillin amidase/acyl-homoserine-lactone acylase|nr:penicillin acylase family protein [Erythrobacter sp.]